MIWTNSLDILVNMKSVSFPISVDFIFRESTVAIHFHVILIPFQFWGWVTYIEKKKKLKSSHHKVLHYKCEIVYAAYSLEKLRGNIINSTWIYFIIASMNNRVGMFHVRCIMLLMCQTLNSCCSQMVPPKQSARS